MGTPGVKVGEIPCKKRDFYCQRDNYDELHVAHRKAIHFDKAIINISP